MVTVHANFDTLLLDDMLEGSFSLEVCVHVCFRVRLREEF